jgi:hypothetical protein
LTKKAIAGAKATRRRAEFLNSKYKSESAGLPARRRDAQPRRSLWNERSPARTRISPTAAVGDEQAQEEIVLGDLIDVGSLTHATPTVSGRQNLLTNCILRGLANADKFVLHHAEI